MTPSARVRNRCEVDPDIEVSVQTEAEIHPPAEAGGPAIKKAGPLAGAKYLAGGQMSDRRPNVGPEAEYHVYLVLAV